MNARTTSAGKWTPQQRLAIGTLDKSLLVSAAAGSGKTAVLAERCVFLICDAPSPCDVDDLLVLTFTEPAAAEMRSRIKSSLAMRAARQPSAHLARQLALVDQAQISTIHSFCGRLLRQHFQIAGIDPSFRILDGDASCLLRAQVSRELMLRSYEGNDSDLFCGLVDHYGDGDDEPIAGQVVGLHELLCSLAEPKRWLDQVRADHRAAAEALPASSLGKLLNEILPRELEALHAKAIATQQSIDYLNYAPYKKFVADRLADVTDWRDALATRGVEALAEHVNAWDCPDLRKGKADENEVAKQIVKELTEEMKTGQLRQWLLFSSQQWQEGQARVLPHAMMLLDLVERFGLLYRQAKDRAHSLDFSDLERLALQILSTPDGQASQIARVCQQRYRHVLVDEYQDINGLQDRILALVSRDDCPDRPSNLFCVGDVKQSIYRFRLADPGRFLERQAMLRTDSHRGQVIDLQANFRSAAKLLDSINGLFERLLTADATEIAYDASHRLLGLREFPPAAPEVPAIPLELHLLQSDGSNVPVEKVSADDLEELDRTEREAMLAARRIRQMMGLEPGYSRWQVADRANPGSRRPIRFGDIVLLLRSLRHKGDQFAQILAANDIPVYCAANTGYFESIEICDMVALLQVLDNREQDIPLATFLRGPLAGVYLPEDAMLRIRRAYPAGGAGAVMFSRAVASYARERQDELAARLQELEAQLDQWRLAAQRKPVDELISLIYQESGYLSFCRGLLDGEQRVANLLALQDRARQFVSSGRHGLGRFLQYLHALEQDTSQGVAPVSSAVEDVVRIMTIHSSKGLEFPVVFLPDLGKRINQRDSAGSILKHRERGLGMEVVDLSRRIRYPSLSSMLVEQRISQQALAEELRVLYVAMTRAEEHLVMLGTVKEGAPEKWQARWSVHRGPLPADHLLSATTMLDWIVPAGVACEAQGRPLWSTTLYSEQEAGSWRPLRERSRKLDPVMQPLAALQPLPESPQPDPQAQEVIARLSFQYKYEPMTRLAAVTSVTGQAERSESEEATLEGAPASPTPGGRSRLALPSFLEEQEQLFPTLSAADRGTATHLVLQHLDLASASDLPQIQRQVEGFLERKLISAAQARAVDLPTIQWFASTPEAELIRANARWLRREQTVYFAQAAGDADPLDRVMVRGRLDLLLAMPERNLIFDYKTDQVSGSAVAARARSYGPQMKLYKEAIERITGRKVEQVYLIFLSPRQVMPLW